MRFFDRIRNRTALFFCLASLLPLAVLATILSGRVSAIVRRSAAETDSALATAVQAAIDERLGLYREQCTAISLTPAIQSLDRRRQSAVLAEFLELNSVFFKVMTFDRAGRVLDVLWKSRYRGEESLIGAPVSDARLSRAVRRTLQSGDHSWTEPSVDSFSQPVLYLVVPVRHFVHDERVEGALAGAISLAGHKIQDLLERAPLPPGAYACIVDDAGQIQARKGDALPAGLEEHTFELEVGGRGTPYLPPVAPVVSGVLRMGERPMLATAARLPGVGLTLIVGRPLAEVMAPADQAARDVMWISAVALVLALIGAVALSHGFVRPLLALVEGIRKVGAGELAHRIPVERTDELGSAAGAFNEMAGELERQQLIEQIWVEEWREERAQPDATPGPPAAPRPEPGP